MVRTLAACVLSAGVGAAVTGGVGLSASATRPQVKTITPRDTAIFTGRSTLHMRKQRGRGVLLLRRSPYRGIGISITRTTIRITRPPDVKVIATYKR